MNKQDRKMSMSVGGSARIDYSGGSYEDCSDYFRLDEEGAPSGTYAKRREVPYHVDPLTGLRALMMSGNDYVNGENMAWERIGQVITKTLMVRFLNELLSIVI